MRIYRVVDEFGFGYKDSLDSQIINWTDMGLSQLMFSDEEAYFERRPLPDNDGIPSSVIREYHLFAFESIEQLHRWFMPADLVLGAILGGKVQVVEVPEHLVVKGGRQVIFDSRESVVVEELPMNHFLSEAEKVSLYDFRESFAEGMELDMEPPARLVRHMESL